MSGAGDASSRGKWTVRNPEGYFDAIQVTGTMIAPILAGFTFAILALVLVPPAKNEADPLRWRDPVLALLVLSALFLIISTQTAIRARATLVKPDELRAWYPSSIDETGEPNAWLAERQKGLEQHTATASTVCRHTYNAGTLLLFTAIAVLLAPPAPVDDARRVALVAAAIAVTVEATWLTGISLPQDNMMERLPTLLTPTTYAVGAVFILNVGSTGASRPAAATGIAIAGIAAAAAAIRLTFSGVDCRIRAAGIVILATAVSAAFATGLLLADWGHAALITDITAAVLILLLIVTVLPRRPVKND